MEPETGNHRHSIVDGQQRLTALLQFVSNEWPLRAQYLEESNRDADFSGKNWDQLSAELKARFWDYAINARVLPSDLTRDEIVVLFRRLNETDKSLNPQEVRNAEFDGEFLKASELVADLPCLKEWDIFPDSQIRRMADIEFASSLLIFRRYGIVSDTPTSINKAYDDFNDRYEEKDRDLAAINDDLEYLNKVFVISDRIKEFFCSPVHLFSLIACAEQFRNRGVSPDRVADSLAAFLDAYAVNDDDDEAVDKRIRGYRNGAAYRTRSRQSRELRIENLVDWVCPVKG